MLKRNGIFWMFLFLTITCGAQQGQGYFTWKRTGNQFAFEGSGRKLAIEFCTPSIFRVRDLSRATSGNEDHWMVIKYDWAPVIVNVKEFKGQVVLSTTQLQLTLFTSALQLVIRNSSGKLLSSEKFEGGGIPGEGDTVQCTKSLQPDEHFFGFGERMDFLDRRSNKVKLNVGRGAGLPYVTGAYDILQANYAPVPFFMSTEGYGIFLHNAYPNEWDMGYSRKDAYSFKAEGGVLDYYFIYGPKFSSILAGYTSLTGRAPLMPLFAYGLHLGTYAGGTWGYEQYASDQYVISLARKLREMGIPVDILWLDSTWRIFGEVGGKGATSFEWRETFKDPKGMFDSLYALHFGMAGLHLRPRFDNGKSIKLLDTAQKLKYTYPEGNYAGEFVNFFDTNSVNFWWQHGVMRLAASGARFLKTDEGSAFGGLANESDKTGPTGKDIAALHNLFPLAYAKAPYEKFQQYNGVRGMNQTREGYAGIQRYPYIFAGDWPSEWQYFLPVIRAGLNIGMSGVGNWAHCMGGFEHNADPELYIRWVQMGMFSPVAIVFGMDHPGYKEPWNYGPDALRNFMKYDSLRYSLLPYIYSNAFQMYQNGTPLMKALVLDYQDDEQVYNIDDQYLFGANLMICPVVTKGAQSRIVYLPEGEWFNYWTGKKYNGKQYLNVVTPLDTIPVYVKAGAIIPGQPAMKYVDEQPVSTLTLDLYPAESSSEFTLYEDDHKSLNYQKGEYALTNIITRFSANGAEFKLMKPVGKFRPMEHDYTIRVHLSYAPSKVAENGRLLTHRMMNEPDKGSWFYDAQQEILYVKTGSDNNKDINITITR